MKKIKSTVWREGRDASEAESNRTAYLRLSLSLYRQGLSVLMKAKAFHYRDGVAVWVESERYKGSGIVTIQDGIEPDQVAVRDNDGNVWSYPIEVCRIK